MSQEMLSPSDYQSRRAQWIKQTGSSIPPIEEMILANSSCLSRLEEHSLSWAEEFMQDFEMEGWVLQQQAQVEKPIGASAFISRMVLHNKQNPPTMGQNIYARAGSNQATRLISVVTPVGSGPDRSKDLQLGMFSRSDIQAPETGLIYLWKSWAIEDLDQMGIEVPWDEPEDFDREPVEE